MATNDRVADALFEGKQREGGRGYFYVKYHDPDDFLGLFNDMIKLPGCLEAWSYDMRLAILAPCYDDLPIEVKELIDPETIHQWKHAFPEVGIHIEDGGLPWHRHPILIIVPRAISDFSMSTARHYSHLIDAVRTRHSVLLWAHERVCAYEHRTTCLRRGAIYRRPPIDRPNRRKEFMHSDYRVRVWKTHLHERTV